MKDPKDIKFDDQKSFHQILDAIGDMILVKGPKSKLLWANKAFCSFYGMSNEQLKGIIDAPFNEPDHTLQYIKDDAQVFETGKILDIPEEKVIRHDGVVGVFHTVKTPILNTDGKPMMTVGVSRDITALKNAQKQLEDQRARSVHSSKMATLGEMAGGIAHEVNTPLATIQLLSEQVTKMMANPEKNREAIFQANERIQKTVMRIAKIVAGLRAISREGAQDSFHAICLKKVIEDVLSFSRERMTHHGVTVTFTVSENLPAVLGSESQLSQVFLNLLSNAHDEVMELKERWIRVELSSTSEEVILRVVDSGNGIREDISEKIFDPFFTTKDIGKGTGLGLSISKNIVKAHQGSLEYERGADHTTFLIVLPAFHEE